MRQCKKQTTIAIIMKDGQFIAMGSNEIHSDIDVCPRLERGMKSGEGYYLCKNICLQRRHAEVDACMKAGGRSNGATLYLIGHSYCCEDCKKVMNRYGIKKIVICEP